MDRTGAAFGAGALPLHDRGRPGDDEDENNNIDLYQRLAPGVVNITSTVLEHDFFFNIVPREGAGSGSIIDPRGYILTNNHVIEDARKLEVTLANGKKYAAKLVGADPDTDVAVLKIDARKEELTVLPMGSSDNLKVGQKAIAIGNPFGLGPDPHHRGGQFRRPHAALLQRDTRGRRHPDRRVHQPGKFRRSPDRFLGKIIGITTAIFSPTGASVGIGFAIPIDTAKRVLKELIEKGYYSYPWLGATLMTLIPDFAEALKLPVQSGAMIVEVAPGRAAEKAGLRGGTGGRRSATTIIVVGGDIIVKVNGQAVSDADAVIRLVRKLRPGDRCSSRSSVGREARIGEPDPRELPKSNRRR